MATDSRICFPSDGSKHLLPRDGSKHPKAAFDEIRTDQETWLVSGSRIKFLPAMGRNIDFPGMGQNIRNQLVDETRTDQ